MRDPVAFSSGQLPTQHFNERFAEENLAYWVPLLIDAAQIKVGHRVLDVGCGTGGFASAIAETAGAAVTGVDSSERFISFARALPPPDQGIVEWHVGDAEALPVEDASFNRALLSLVLHQLARPQLAVAEAFRALIDGGIVLVRTIAPEDVGARVPERYFPAMARADCERLPSLDAIERWLKEAGFVVMQRRRLLRNKKLNLADEERQVQVEARFRYPFISSAELEEGLSALRADAKTHGGDWIDPRPTHLIIASKPPRDRRAPS